MSHSLFFIVSNLQHSPRNCLEQNMQIAELTNLEYRAAVSLGLVCRAAELPWYEEYLSHRTLIW